MTQEQFFQAETVMNKINQLHDYLQFLEKDKVLKLVKIINEDDQSIIIENNYKSAFNIYLLTNSLKDYINAELKELDNQLSKI